MNSQLSDEERQSQAVSPAALEYAVALFNTRGYAILDNVFPAARIDELNEIVSRSIAVKGISGSRLTLPAASPFTDPDVAENASILGLVDQIVGADCVLRVIAADRFTPGSLASEDVQIDAKPLFPETEHSRFPSHKLQITIPFTDLTIDNGAPELWPGTHTQPEHFTVRYGKDMIQKLAGALPSEKVIVPKGSVLIRDSRLWYRQPSIEPEQAATSLTLIYQRWWDITGSRQQISKEVHDNASQRLKKLFRFEALPSRKQ